jgi:hypothetical protein
VKGGSPAAGGGLFRHRQFTAELRSASRLQGLGWATCLMFPTSPKLRITAECYEGVGAGVFVPLALKVAIADVCGTKRAA